MESERDAAAAAPKSRRRRGGFEVLKMALIALLAVALWHGLESDENPWPNIYEDSAPSVVEILSRTGSGSGFLFRVGKRTVVVTNQHVVDPPLQLRVQFKDRIEGEAVVLDASERNDLAVMEIPSANLDRYRALDKGRSSALRIGEELMTIGHPIGESHHISVGFYTGKFTHDGRTLLRMSMPVDPGNSGGPLFNRRGEVVGVVSQKRSEGNIAYAVPIEKINDFAY